MTGDTQEIEVDPTEFFRGKVRSEAEKQGLDPDFAERIARQESGFKHHATSSKGARGIMQLMPGTAKQLGVNPDNPDENIAGGIKYLKQQHDKFGNQTLAAAAYNAGPGSIKNGRVPRYKETQAYVQATARDKKPQEIEIDPSELKQAAPSSGEIEIDPSELGKPAAPAAVPPVDHSALAAKLGKNYSPEAQAQLDELLTNKHVKPNEIVAGSRPSRRQMTPQLRGQQAAPLGKTRLATDESNLTVEEGQARAARGVAPRPARPANRELSAAELGMRTSFEEAKKAGDITTARRNAAELRREGWETGEVDGWPYVKPPKGSREPSSQGGQAFAESERAASPAGKAEAAAELESRRAPVRERLNKQRIPGTNLPMFPWQGGREAATDVAASIAPIGGKLLSAAGQVVDYLEPPMDTGPKPTGPAFVADNGNVLQQAGEAIQRKSREVSEAAGLEPGKLKTAVQAVSETAPKLLIPGGAVGFGIESGLERLGSEDRPGLGEALKTGIGTGLGVAGMNRAGKFMEKAIPAPGAAASAGRFAGRAAANIGVQPVVNAAIEGATGGKAELHAPTPEEIAFGGAFALAHPGDKQSGRRIRHERFGEGTVDADQSGVQRGHRRVTFDNGDSKEIRVVGKNRLAQFINDPEAQAAETQQGAAPTQERTSPRAEPQPTVDTAPVVADKATDIPTLEPQPPEQRQPANAPLREAVDRVKAGTATAEDHTAVEKALYTHDLTGLPNKRAYDESNALDPESHHAALDIVGLKDTNDTYGHGTGDELLKAVAKVVNEEHPGRAFHISGDEFMLKGTPEELATVMGPIRERLKSATVESTAPDGTVHILEGIGLHHGIGETPDAANEAVNVSKATAPKTDKGRVAGGMVEKSTVGQQDNQGVNPPESGPAEASRVGTGPVGEQPQDVAPEPASRTFTTAKGSTYEVHADGTTTRNKSFHPEHGAADQGPQPRSDKTYYVTAEDAEKLGEFQTKGSAKTIEEIGDGRIGVRHTDGPSAGRFERRTAVMPETQPRVGLIPVEIWKGGKRVHFGNEITKTGADGSTSGAPEPAKPTEPSEISNAEFDKRWLAETKKDVADEVAAKTKPLNDEIERLRGEIARDPKNPGNAQKETRAKELESQVQAQSERLQTEGKPPSTWMSEAQLKYHKEQMAAEPLPPSESSGAKPSTVEPPAPEPVEPHHSEAQPRDEGGRFNGPPDPAITGIKHSVIEAERDLRGLPAFQKARRAHPQSFDEGVAAVHSGEIDPRVLASEQATAKRARPLSTTESMALLYDRMRITNDLRAAGERLDAAKTSGDAKQVESACERVRQLNDLLAYNDEAAFRSGSEAGRGLAIRREMIKDDYSRARVISTARAMNKGKELPPEVEARLTGIADELQRANDRVAQLEEQARVTSESKQAELSVKAMEQQAQREARKARRAQKKQDIQAELAALDKEFAEKAGSLHAGIDPSLIPLIGKIAYKHVQSGITSLEGLVDAVHAFIKDKLDGVSKDDVRAAIIASQKLPEEAKPGLTQEQRLGSYKTRQESKKAEKQAELLKAVTGEKRAKPTREELKLDDEAKVAKRNAQKLQRQIQTEYAKIDWANKTKSERALAYAAGAVRGGVLSGVATVGKIGSALAHRMVFSPLENLAGEATRRIFPKVAAKAPRHGQGINAGAEMEALKGAYQGVKEIPGLLWTGETPLSMEHAGRHPGQIPTKAGSILEFPGRVHAAEKNIAKSAEYRRSVRMNEDWARSKGLDPRDSDVREAIEKRAYEDANESILMGDNAFNRSWSRAESGWSDKAKSLSRIAAPVRRVPWNYIRQSVGEYGLGLLRGTRRALMARNPELMEKMTPEEADKTMRLLNRGVIGMIGMAIGGATGNKILGGYWQRGEGNDEDKPKPGEVKIGPLTIPHTYLHAPPDELAQIAATFSREIKQSMAKGEGAGKGTWSGAAAVGQGTLHSVPFLGQTADVYDALRSGDAASDKAGQIVAAWVEPQIIKELAKVIDREDRGQRTRNPLRGEPMQRKPQGFLEQLQAGLPFARESLDGQPGDLRKFYGKLGQANDKAKEPGQTQADQKAHGVLVKAENVLSELKKRRAGETDAAMRDRITLAMNTIAAEAMTEAKGKPEAMGERGELPVRKRRLPRNVRQAVQNVFAP